MPVVTIKKSKFPSDLGISSMSNANALVMSVLTRECSHYMPRLPVGVFSQLIQLRNLNLPFVPPNKELGQCQPDYDNDRIRIERNPLHGHMEDGLHDYGITARSGGSGAKYLSRGYPFAGQPTVDGGDDAHQPFGVEGDDSTLGVFLAVSRISCRRLRPTTGH